MDSENILLVIAVMVFAVSIIAAGFTYLSVGDYAAKLSGLATGETNLTVETRAAINFTTDSVNWGSGLVDENESSATLDTLAGTVERGNWTTIDYPLNLQNIGNVNVSINLSATKTADTFLGGTNPVYQWNVSDSLLGSCLNTSGGTLLVHPLSTYQNPNTTATAQWCGIFQFIDSADNLTIDFNLTVPSDSFTGALGDTITATAVAV